jgi:hypothetical protein
MSDVKRVSVNEQKIAHGKQKLQQASSAAKDKLQKALHAALNPGNCGGYDILKLIQRGEEYERLL